MTTLPSVPKVSIGLSSILGSLIAVVAAAAAIVAGVKGNDVGTIAGGAVALGTALKTIDSRTSQALELARRGLHAVRPAIDRLDDGLAKHVDPAPGRLGTSALVSTGIPTNAPAPSTLRVDGSPLPTTGTIA